MKVWHTKKLGEVCSLLNRGVSPAYLEAGGICVLNQKCVRDHIVSYEPSRRHNSMEKKVAEERFIRLGDVLVNSTGTGTLGRVAQVRDEPAEATTVDSHITIVRPKPGLFHLDFFGYMLILIEEEIKAAGEGCGGQTELARSVLADRFSVSYPESLPEQHRIVAILDEAFEAIATAKANAEKNLQNARAVFESYLESVFTERGSGWVRRPLGDVCEFENGDRGKNYPNRSEYVESGIPWINTGHIQKDGTLSATEMNFITREKYTSLRSGKIQPGDLVYCLRGATLGKTALVDPFAVGAVASSLVILRPGSLLESRFLYFFLTSPFGQGLIKGYENGAAQPNLGARSVAKYLISLPPRIEQKHIILKLDNLFTLTQTLTQIYQRKLLALDELKKSLLHQAFSGAL
jgi:type I restriction enzyme, S subunit